jgi:phosphoribosyl-ATP pyrophosphohydrolase
MAGSEILERLDAVIAERRGARPAGSYVVRLLDGGHDAIAAKVREESEELIEATGSRPLDADHAAHEAADLLFHVLVLLAEAGVGTEAVFAELTRRFGTGGLDEKASRGRREKGGEC